MPPSPPRSARAPPRRRPRRATRAPARAAARSPASRRALRSARRRRARSRRVAPPPPSRGRAPPARRRGRRSRTPCAAPRRAGGGEVADELRRHRLGRRRVALEHRRDARVPGGARRRPQLVDQHPPDQRVREAVLPGPAVDLDQDPVAHGALEVVGRAASSPRISASIPASIVSPKSAATASVARQSSPSRSSRRATPRARRAARAARPSRLRDRPRSASRWTISPTKNGLPFVSRCSASPSAAGVALRPRRARSSARSARRTARRPGAGASTARGRAATAWRRTDRSRSHLGVAIRGDDEEARVGQVGGDELEQLERRSGPPSGRRRARRPAPPAWRLPPRKRLTMSKRRKRAPSDSQLSLGGSSGMRSRSTGNTCASSAPQDPAAAATASCADLIDPAAAAPCSTARTPAPSRPPSRVPTTPARRATRPRRRGRSPGGSCRFPARRRAARRDRFRRARRRERRAARRPRRAIDEGESRCEHPRAVSPIRMSGAKPTSPSGIHLRALGRATYVHSYAGGLRTVAPTMKPTSCLMERKRIGLARGHLLDPSAQSASPALDGFELDDEGAVLSVAPVMRSPRRVRRSSVSSLARLRLSIAW